MREGTEYKRVTSERQEPRRAAVVCVGDDGSLFSAVGHARGVGGRRELERLNPVEPESDTNLGIQIKTNKPIYFWNWIHAV